MKSLPAIYLISFAFQMELEKRLRMNRRELGEQYAEMQSFQDIRYLSACSLSQVLLMRIPGHPAYEYARSHYVTLGHVRRGLRNCDFHSSSLLDPCITHGTRYTCLTQV